MYTSKTVEINVSICKDFNTEIKLNIRILILPTYIIISVTTELVFKCFLKCNISYSSNPMDTKVVMSNHADMLPIHISY